MEILIIKDNKTVTNVDLSLKKLFGRNLKVADDEAGKILRNKKLRKKVVFTLAMAIMLVLEPTSFAHAATGAGGFDSLGRLFWGYVKVIARWGCLIMCGIDIVKNLNNGDVRGLGRVIAKYVIAYAAIVYLPWLFDQIDGAIL